MAKDLEKWQLEDAARLKQLFTERSEENQAQFGTHYGIGSQGMIWQYLNGKRPLNLSALLKFSRGLRVAPKCISPTLAAELDIAGSVQIQDGTVSFEIPLEPDPLIKEAVSLLKQLSPALRAQAFTLLKCFADMNIKKSHTRENYSSTA